MLEWACRVGDDAVAAKAVQLADWSWDAGWDDARHGGGLKYFVDAEGRDDVCFLERDMKLWWPHCEAMVAMLLAFERTRDGRHWARFEQAAEYALAHFSDAAGGGEWYGYCDRDGRVTHPFKGGPYKGCFHVPRALLKCEAILE